MPGGLELKFSHMQLEKNKYDWKGGQIAYAGFDEVTSFSRSQFFYIISRLRSLTGVGGYIRATCNPDAESWVAKFIEWWIDQDTGLPIPERDGVLRYFIRNGDEIIWADDRERLSEDYGPELGEKALSVTFIKASVFDNKILLEKDPQYLANLNALDRVERARLRDGNWKVKASAGNIFRRSDFKVIQEAPPVVRRIRYWDRAATKVNPQSPNPDWTVGVDMGETADKRYIIFHVERFRESVHQRDTRMKSIASSDGKVRTIGMEHDPGQAGKAEAAYLAQQFRGFDIRFFPVHKDKITRSRPFSAQAQAGNVYLVEGAWNEAFLLEHENFPPDETKKTNSVDGEKDEDGAGKDDQVDASSGAFNFLTGDNVGTVVAASQQGSSKPMVGSFNRTSTEW